MKIQCIMNVYGPTLRMWQKYPFYDTYYHHTSGIKGKECSAINQAEPFFTFNKSNKPNKNENFSTNSI